MFDTGSPSNPADSDRAQRVIAHSTSSSVVKLMSSVLTCSRGILAKGRHSSRVWEKSIDGKGFFFFFFLNPPTP
jgi:hypothetical protein